MEKIEHDVLREIGKNGEENDEKVEKTYECLKKR